MSLSDLASQAPKPIGKGPYVGLSIGICSQIVARGAHQAQISVNIPGSKEFSSFRGPISLIVVGREFNLEKTDTHAVWFSSQVGEGEREFTVLFNTLHEELEESGLKRVRIPAEISFNDVE